MDSPLSRSSDSPLSTPRTVSELAAVADPTARARAAVAYLRNAEAKIAEARSIRDAALLELLHDLGVTATARTVGMSSTHVKGVRAARRGA